MVVRTIAAKVIKAQRMALRSAVFVLRERAKELDAAAEECAQQGAQEAYGRVKSTTDELRKQASVIESLL